MKKYYAGMLFAFAMAAGLCGCSSSEDELPPDRPGGNNGETIVSPMENKADSAFVGSWSGMGPYLASGVSASKYGLVKGTWRFYNDGTYYWYGKNSYDYSYSETGNWHYNAEKKLLVTEGTCQIIWQIEEIREDGVWVGTPVVRGGMYVYTPSSEETPVEPSMTRVIDYKKNALVVRDTVINYALTTERLKCGVCYGKSNDDLADFTKIYADSLYLHSGMTPGSSIYSSRVYDLTISGLEEDGKYRLCSFIEYADGTVKYGKEYKAVCITPPENGVYMGEEVIYQTMTSGKIKFWSKSAIGFDGNFAEEGKNGAELSKIDAEEALTALGNGWRLPKAKEYPAPMQGATSFVRNATLLEREEGDLLALDSPVNGNRIVLPFWENDRPYGVTLRHTPAYMIDFIREGNSTNSNFRYQCEFRDLPNLSMLEVYGKNAYSAQILPVCDRVVTW